MKVKQLKLKISLALLVIIFVFIAVQWKSWFGQVTEKAYNTPAYKIDRIMMSLGQEVASQRSISWRCDTVKRDHQFKLVQTDTFDTIYISVKNKLIHTQGGKSVHYRVDIDDLKLGETYFYQINNAKDTTQWYRFKMGDVSQKFSFVYIGDIQDKAINENSEVLKNIINHNTEVDFYAFGGDVVERPLEKYWSIWFKNIGEFSCEKPFIACAGNHEYHKGIVKKIDKRWIHYWPQPHNGTRKYKGRCSYMHYKNALLVILDTDGICLPLDLKEQYSWVKEVLMSSKAKWKIVLMHHPVKSLRKGRINISSKYFFKPLFEKAGVDLVLQGHDHGYGRMATQDDKGRSKAPVYIISSCSQKSYTPTHFESWDRMAAFRKMYQKITITPDSLVYKSFDVEKGLYDALVIDAGDKKVIEHNIYTPELLEPSNKLKKKGGNDLQNYLDNVAKRKAAGGNNQ